MRHSCHSLSYSVGRPSAYPRHTIRQNPLRLFPHPLVPSALFYTGTTCAFLPSARPWPSFFACKGKPPRADKIDHVGDPHGLTGAASSNNSSTGTSSTHDDSNLAQCNPDSASLFRVLWDAWSMWWSRVDLASFWHLSTKTSRSHNSISDGVLGAIGNTPLIRIRSLSEASGCEILGKAEFLNPGGSVKDRVALQIIEDALSSGQLRPGGLISEGSAGSTGISLALVASAKDLRCFVAMPDDSALEKTEAIRAYGAEVVRVPPVGISHPDHFVHVAERRAEEAAREDRDDEGEDPSSSGAGGLFADQFENLANFRAHYGGTGPEIWEQTGGRVDAFVAAAGTGGTIAGVSCFLKEKNPQVKCFLIDPPGSGLYNRVTRGVMYSRVEAEGKRLRNPQDTITEGIGINRVTANFEKAKLDGALKGTDWEAVEMSRVLLEKDGLFVGSSSAMNCVGAMKVAQQLGPGHTIVTILCDSGSRYLSKFYNQEYLNEWFADKKQSAVKK